MRPLLITRRHLNCSLATQMPMQTWEAHFLRKAVCKMRSLNTERLSGVLRKMWPRKAILPGCWRLVQIHHLETDRKRFCWLKGLAVCLVEIGQLFYGSLLRLTPRPAVLPTQYESLNTRDGLRRIWFSFDSPSQYFPLVYTTFRIEHALWGLNPLGYHWVNILLHVANALLVWRLLARLNVPGAWLAGAIFALHPVQVESVAWITERKNVLMGCFFLLTLLAWAVFVDERTKRPWRFYGLASVPYGLALSAKTTACTLPAALLLILWLQRKRINWESILQIVPFFLLGLGMGLVAVWWERYHQATRGALFALGPIERILVASRAVWFYLGKLIWPSTLTFIYPRWTISPTHLLDYVWLLTAVGLCAAIYFARRYVGRGVEVAAVFFVATLSPVLGLIMLYTFRYAFVADHYQYLACIGPIALVSAGVASLAGTFERSRRLIFGTAVAMVATLAVLTWRQSTMYTDIEAVWRTTLARNPTCWMAHNNLGIVLFQKSEIDEAIAHYG